MRALPRLLVSHAPFRLGAAISTAAMLLVVGPSLMAAQAPALPAGAVPLEGSVSAAAALGPPCCSISGRVTDGATGRAVPGVRVVFRRPGARILSWPVGVSAITDASGAYSVAVSEGSYSVVASHPAYIMHASLPSLVAVRAPYYREVTISPEIGTVSVEVTADAHKTVNLRLARRSSGVLLVTTSRLEQTWALESAIASYRDALLRNEGMRATLVVIDSDECLESYGVRYTGGFPDGTWPSQDQWKQLRDVIKRVAGQERASYIVLLGGVQVLPRPVVLNSAVESLETDTAYVDFNDDLVVDSGYVVSRFPDVGTASSAVVAAMETAVAMHDQGGYDLSTQARFSTECWAAPPIGLGNACDPDDIICGPCYKAPPFGTCDDCAERAEFERLVSTSGFLSFMGHGSPTRFLDNERKMYFDVEALDSIDLGGNPVVFSLFPCDAGDLKQAEPTWATEMLRKGASVYVARTTTLGSSPHVAALLPAYIWGTDVARPYRVGDALFDLMREAVLYNGAGEGFSTIQLNLYGDPTLSLRPSLPGFAPWNRISPAKAVQ